mmetsp:Transcript_9533/g.13651  ORF Transcript_9533/g.13651 Transcript_9533/m.13651 type:complete len:297 (-) Transcript_9533:1130-2020(-)
MSSSINKNVNVERRTWDKETFEARARSRAAAEAAERDDNLSSHAQQQHLQPNDEGGSGGGELKNQINPTEEKEEFLPAHQGRAGPMGSKRAFLKSRTQKVDLEGKLGTSEIIDPAAASATKSNLTDNDVLKPSSGVSKCSDGVGWHCRVCDCFLKDSLTYLDHINGRKHQRYLGYSMRVEKSTTEEVSGVLKGLAEKKREREGKKAGVETAIDFEDVVRQKDEEALKRKAERARKREERKRRERGELQEEVVVQDKNNDAEKNPAEEGEEEDVEEEGMHPDLAAMMGFSGFGGSRK